MKNNLPLLLLALVAMAPVTNLTAATVINSLETDSVYYPQSGGGGSNTNPDFWTNSFTTTNNVLYGLSATSSTGNFGVEAGSGAIGNLTDGISPLTKPVLATVGGTGGTQVIFSLLGPKQLSSIVYYGGWTDGARSDVLFNVSYSTDNGANYTLLFDPAAPHYSLVGDPARQNLTTVGTAGNDPTKTFSKWIGGDGAVTNMVTISDDTGTLAGGAAITNLKFDFFGGRNGYNGAMELAAYTVPEPSLSILCAVGALAGVVRRRR
ncbi:MAG: hypothetical protein JWO82_3001 [Akkermansiaceae bacterium]|nr:hypothetical protein [Akkermansiaceae bacterium]